MLRFNAWFQASLWSHTLYASGILPGRNTLPEPLDVQDHLGNVPDSILAAGSGALAACAALRLSSAPSRVRRVALGAGLFFGMLANAVAETKLGQQLFHIQEMGNSGYAPNQDPIDFAYGTLAGIGAAALLVKPRNHDFVPQAPNGGADILPQPPLGMPH